MTLLDTMAISLLYVTQGLAKMLIDGMLLALAPRLFGTPVGKIYHDFLSLRLLPFASLGELLLALVLQQVIL